MRQVGDRLSIDFVGRTIYNQRSVTHRVSDRTETLRFIHKVLSLGHEPD